MMKTSPIVSSLAVAAFVMGLGSIIVGVTTPKPEPANLAPLKAEVRVLTDQVSKLTDKLTSWDVALRVTDLEAEVAKVRDCLRSVTPYVDNLAVVISNIQRYGLDPNGYIDGPGLTDTCEYILGGVL